MNAKSWSKRGIFVCSSAALLALSACSSGGGANGGNTAANIEQKNMSGSGSGGKQAITMSVVSTNRFLQQAEEKFEAANPDIDIQIKESHTVPQDGTGRSSIRGGYDPATIEKHVTTVNAELMNGNASDIIAVDTLAYSKYADKGLLTDLTQYMSKLNAEDYYMNVFDSLKYKDKLYTITPAVSTGLWFGNKERIEGMNLDPKAWTWEQFAEKMGELAKAGGDPAVQWMPTDMLLIDRVSAEAEKFINLSDKKASFDDKTFIDLLNQIKSFYDQKIFQEPQMTGGVSKAVKIGEKLSRKEAFLPSVFMNISSVTFGQMVFDQPQIFSPPKSGSAEGNSFKSTILLSINNKSEKKEAAWKFLQFLLSEEMQSSRELGGLPVNKKAIDGQVKEMEQMEGAPKPTPEDVEMTKGLLADLKRSGTIDPKIETIIKDETAPFFEGQKSAEDAAKSIQNKVALYLEE
ncbi:carbohydrate ABC transporter substrate-binding protein, CUT1 family [Paenibacillaceae bacterium GAS479]|nr:carbohydrate ABC transporter substrate-binding protein, CUT1 family [Paenibacillaceae bacterium GAS479]